MNVGLFSFLISSVLVASISAPAVAKETSRQISAQEDLRTACLDTSFIEQINQEFKITFNEITPWKSLCDDKDPKVKLYKSLRVLTDIRLSSAPLNNRYNRHLLKDGFFHFLKQRTHKITQAAPETLACKNGAMAFVIPTTPDEMFICSSFFEEEYSIYYTASVILHEARHSEGHEHTLCLLGSKMGNNGGCDETIEEDGAYAVSTEALAKMALRGLNISPSDRRDLKLTLLDSLDSFNEPVEGRRNSAVYLITRDQKKAFIFDGKDLHPAPLVKNADVLSRNHSLIISPHDKSQARALDTMAFGLPEIAPEGLCALSYNQMDPANRPRLVEIINEATASACIFENKIVGVVGPGNLEREDSIVSTPFSIKQIFAGDELGFEYMDSLFALGNDKKFYRIKFDDRGDAQITQSRDLRQQFKKRFYFDSDLSGLLEDGRLVILDFETEQWKVFPGLENLRFDSVSRPFLWSPDIF